MKKFFLIGFMGLCAVSMVAQGADRQQREGNRRQFNPEQRYERLKQDLNLTNQQLDSLKAVEKEMFANFGQEARASRQLNTEERAKAKELTEEQKQRAAEMKTRSEQYEARLKNFLSDEQIAKYKESRRNFQGQRPDGRRGDFRRGERGINPSDSIK
ncbi:MAG: hypothetical protein LBE91_06010 [Tannerella sp.]|jgi:hypothetical protein|nr:hypothetical protein [Tannerella sp.]